MGQRHQIFVIARINGHYQGLAVVHRQWLSGAAALICCLRLLDIFAATENRIPLEQELTDAQHRDRELWDSTISWTTDLPVPFPFIMTCLVVGSSLDPETAEVSTAHTQPYNMYFNAGDNNDGITIIDITKLDRIRYCFVHFEQSIAGEPLNTPLPPSVYLWAYQDLSYYNWTEILELVKAFEKWELIDVDTLRDAWPKGSWESPQFDNEKIDLSALPKALQPPKRIQCTASEQTNNSVTQCSVPHLQDMAAAILIESALERPDDLDVSWVDVAKGCPGFLSILKSRLYDNPELVESSPMAVALLATVLEHQSYVDLSPFPNLSPEKVIGTMEQLQCTGRMTSLNLSNNRDITEAVLEKVLTVSPALTCLYVFNVPKLPLYSVVSALAKTNATLCDLYHSDLFKKALRYTEIEDYSFSRTRSCCSVARIAWIECVPHKNAVRLDDGGLNWGECFRTQPDLLSSGGYGAFGLNDAFLPPVKVVAGLLRFLSHMLGRMRPYFNLPGTMGKMAAISFGMASSVIEEAKFGIGPLPPTLYNAKEAFSMYNMKPGEWTLIVLHELEAPPASGPGRLRYAFINLSPRLSSPTVGKLEQPSDRMIIADMRTFLEHVLGAGQKILSRASELQELQAYWDSETGRLRTKFGSGDNGEDETLFKLSGEQETQNAIRALKDRETERVLPLGFSIGWH
jgi:hypothetical protein